MQELKPIDLKNAKFNQLGQVPFMQYIDLANRLMRLIGASVCVSVGTDSFAIGLGVLFGLSVLLSAIDKTKSE